MEQAGPQAVPATPEHVGSGKTLRQESLESFCALLAARTPTPGGGAACALTGALGAAQAQMCAAFTTGERYQKVEARAQKALAEFKALQDRFLDLMERDAEAYGKLVAARQLPKGSPGRKEALSAAREGAIRVPEETLAAASEGLALLAEFAPICNPNLLTDVVVATDMLGAAATGAACQFDSNSRSLPPHTKGSRDIRAMGRLSSCRSATGRIQGVVRKATRPPPTEDGNADSGSDPC